MQPSVLRQPTLKGALPKAATAELYYGMSCLKSLPHLVTNSIHTVCTSPPYWGHRKYKGGDTVFRDWKGPLGWEPTPELYVSHLVEIFQEVRRVLRDDGTLWLNLGDSYIKSRIPGYKVKDLAGIPWMVASALRADGWWLRSEMVWAKEVVMPESVRDRPTRSHEHLFLLAKSSDYFYDGDAIREPQATAPQSGPTGRNRRTIWRVNPKPSPGSHFAVWPPDLVKPMVLAGSAPKVCEKCGAPWGREVVRRETEDTGASTGGDPDRKEGGHRERDTTGKGGNRLAVRRIGTNTWNPSCPCEGREWGRAVVLDPFSGSGTTGEVALTIGRNYVGLDIGADYLSLAEARIQGRQPNRTGEPLRENDFDWLR